MRVHKQTNIDGAARIVGTIVATHACGNTTASITYASRYEKRPANHQHTHAHCINCVTSPVETTLWELIARVRRITERAQLFEVSNKQLRSSTFVVCCGNASLRNSTPINSTQKDLKSRGQVVASFRGTLANCQITKQIVGVFGDALANTTP